MGIHTGESIVVAPSQTLNDAEYQLLRTHRDQDDRATSASSASATSSTRSIRRARDYRVIEVNARLSRSSRARQQGHGLSARLRRREDRARLHAAARSRTRSPAARPRFFEPALDYVVCKVPRWDLGKFRGASMRIGSEMKSVGEVMAHRPHLPRGDPEGAAHARHRREGPRSRRVRVRRPRATSCATPRRCASSPSPQALRDGHERRRDPRAHARSTRWFLHGDRADRARCTRSSARPRRDPSTPTTLRDAKQLGFSDRMIGYADRRAARRGRAQRAHAHGIRAAPRRRSTRLAAEFPAETNYLYSTYHASRVRRGRRRRRKKILVLGSGAYRIGSSVEFDWCCVNAIARRVRQLGYETIMLNYNPETVSTDYDICDKLVFDEISLETVLDLYEREQPYGRAWSAWAARSRTTSRMRLHKPGVTHPRHQRRQSIDTRGGPQQVQRAARRARHRSAALGSTSPTLAERRRRSSQQLGGFPVLVRPSYVLVGAAMSVAHEPQRARAHPGARQARLARAPGGDLEVRDPRARDRDRRGGRPRRARAVGDQRAHRERRRALAATRRSCCRRRRCTSRPSARVDADRRRRWRARSTITGPFNIQFLAKNNEVKVIECNLRASRSFPFVSKVTRRELRRPRPTRRMLGDPQTEVRADRARPRLRRREGADVLVLATRWAPTRCSASRWRPPARSAASATTCTRRCCTRCCPRASAFPKRGVLLSLGPAARQVRVRRRGAGDSRRPQAAHLRHSRHRRRAARARHRVAPPWANPREQSAVEIIEKGAVDLVINIPRTTTRKAAPTATGSAEPPSTTAFR